MGTWVCKAVPKFWEKFNNLPVEQQEDCKAKLAIFKINPFDSRLGWNGKPPHKIHKLSSRMGCTVFGGHIQGNLVFCFVMTASNEVTTLDLGTHDIYK
jgi:hypothetical protein